MQSDVPFAEQLRVANEFAQTLLGLDVPTATERASGHGYLVGRVGLKYDQVLTADLRANRITLDCSDDDIVESATAG